MSDFVTRSILPPVCGCLLLFAATAAAKTSTEKVDFRDVKLLLSDRCFVCHGPDAENREADLRLDMAEGAFRESESGYVERVIEPGDPDASELIRRITAAESYELMPPPEANLALTAAEIDLLRRWVEQGAPWQRHWAFMPPQAVALPDGTQPDEAIDALVERRLRPLGLQLAPPTSRQQLIRRVTFDLTGLPPTLAEIDAFLADTSPHAYERVVDRLLASPRFGERMAADWLDVARYSDTFGYQVDRDRFVWPWRDWVVRALNANMPYDQFITEQLAGDLLPGATQDQILATTFNRLHPQKVEGGSVPEEFRIEYVADRAQTFATAFLGLTLECARCHDHKYDPITQREYYQLTAFFDKIDEAGLYSYFTSSVPTPTLLLREDDQQAKMDELADAIRREERKLADVAESRREAFQQWRSRLPSEDISAEIGGRIAHLDFEQSAEGANRFVPGVVGQAVRLSGDDGIDLNVGNFTRHDPFSIACWLKAPERRERAVVFHRSRAWTDAGSRGYELLIEDGRLRASLIHFWPGNAISVKSVDELPIDEWHHVVMTYDGSSRASGLRIHVDGKPADVEVARDQLYKNITGGGNDHLTIGQRFRDMGLKDGCVDEFQVFDRELTSLEVAQLHDGATLTQTLATSPDARAEDGALFAYFLAHDDAFRQQLASLRDARRRHGELVDGIQEIMVMRESEGVRETFLLKRGAYDARQEVVHADTPAVLPAMDPESPRNRLGLARWLTDPEHPLTARVAVNRFWQLFFGEGLVRTPEDFGSQGQVPTHPELLDWLARDFVGHGWDVKRLLKQLVMSRTYRQRSAASPELRRRDPENRLLARAPSYRWPAEMLRDQALAVAGLLVEQVGGPPAKPYELAESFKPAQPDEGTGLYRRSLYTYWKRTGPAPAMMALDAAKRDVCRVRRGRTSSPLQTLVLMNGPQFVEAARLLARDALQEHADDTDQALAHVFRTLTSRPPTERELRILSRLHADQWERFTTTPEQADAYLQVGARQVEEDNGRGKLAALASVANALFALDECMMKR